MSVTWIQKRAPYPAPNWSPFATADSVDDNLFPYSGLSEPGQSSFHSPYPTRITTVNLNFDDKSNSYLFYNFIHIQSLCFSLINFSIYIF